MDLRLLLIAASSALLSVGWAQPGKQQGLLELL